MLTTESEVPVAGAVVEIVFTQYSVEALVVSNVGVIEIINVVDRVVIEPGAQFPFHVAVDLALTAQVCAGAHFDQ